VGRVTSVRIADDLVDGLEAIATEKDRPKAWVLNQALREYLDRQKIEKQRWLDTEAALADLERGAVVDAEEVHTWMDSWGSENELPKPRPR
jgi:predicted transcriptional regulator